MNKYLLASPIIVILRGITLNTVDDIVIELYRQGIRIIEVPLNRDEAFECIERIIEILPDDCLIGAGTVISIEQIDRLAMIGAKLIVSPHCDSQLIQSAIKRNMFVLPGVSTPTEAYNAINAGATALKLFPANSLGYEHFSAMKSILPKQINIIAVGGITANNINIWLSLGVDAVGIGSEIYKEKDSLVDVQSKLVELTSSIKN